MINKKDLLDDSIDELMSKLSQILEDLKSGETVVSDGEVAKLGKEVEERINDLYR